MAHSLVNLIDAKVEDNHAMEFPFRFHLGGSLVGNSCARAIWYSFRWAKRPVFKGRILRLFERGHKEEFRFVEYLQLLGIEVQAYSERLFYFSTTDQYFTYPWDVPLDDETRTLALEVTNSEYHIKRAETKDVKLKQWRISGVNGHYGGSLDGKATRVPGFYPDQKFLCEFKTHNTKSFCKLVAEGVRVAKPEHYAQMQTYMTKQDLKFAIYMAVNKNDDDLHIEIVAREEGAGDALEAKAASVIGAQQPLARAGKHPSAMVCKFCDYAKICHYGEPMEVNCRTCVNSTPVEDGKWYCKHWDVLIPNEAQLAGCSYHKPITD